jgi:hypothetical protein
VVANAFGGKGPRPKMKDFIPDYKPKLPLKPQTPDEQRDIILRIAEGFRKAGRLKEKKRSGS